MKELIYDELTKEQEKYLKDILDIGVNFLTSSSHFQYKSLKDLKNIVSEELPQEEVINNDIFIKDLKNIVVKNSISQHSYSYLAFPDTGNSITGIASDILSTFLNQNLIAVDRSAPVATLIEAQLILWLKKMIGFKSPNKVNELNNLSSLGGLWTSGGNMSNHIAILTALQNTFPTVIKEGLMSLQKKPKIMLCSGIDHFSFRNAVKALGLGEDCIIPVKPTKDFKTSISDLEDQYNIHNDENTEIFMVISVAGNCRTTNIDNILDISHFCKKNKIWHHVDACHGGSLIFSNKLKSKLLGIEDSDSVSIDPHKGLFMTYPSSYILFKDPQVLEHYSRYKDKIYDENVLDLGLITPFYGSRDFSSLKLWSFIKRNGFKKISKLVEDREKTYFKLHNSIKDLKYFTALNLPEFYRSAFVFYPDSLKKQNLSNESKEILIQKYTKLFNDRLYKKGEVILDDFSLKDYNNSLGLDSKNSFSAIGLAVGHPNIPEKEIKKIIHNIHETAQPLENQLLSEISNIDSVIYNPQNSSPASW